MYGSPTGVLEEADNQRSIQPFAEPADGQNFGFALSVGSYLGPGEVNLVVGIPGWTGTDEDGSPIKNAGAVAVFRTIREEGLAGGSPSGFIHKDQVEMSPTWSAVETIDEMILPSDWLMLGDWAGERFGAALSH
jgi:hypothetical protein